MGCAFRDSFAPKYIHWTNSKTKRTIYLALLFSAISINSIIKRNKKRKKKDKFNIKKEKNKK